jgi:hypothetical protein
MKQHNMSWLAGTAGTELFRGWSHLAQLWAGSTGCLIPAGVAGSGYETLFSGFNPTGQFIAGNGQMINDRTPMHSA